jgi:diguanylate cyclase (GGDEF)-like protein
VGGGRHLADVVGVCGYFGGGGVRAALVGAFGSATGVWVTSGDVAAAMASALRRNTDFGATLGSTVALRPHMTNAQFGDWLDSTKALSRYPGGVGYVYIASVPAAKLPAFVRLVMHDQPPAAIPATRYILLSSSSAPAYCLIRLGIASPGSRIPLGADLCDPATMLPGIDVTNSGANVLRVGADAGEFSVLPIDSEHGLFSIVVPVFRGGQTPATVAGRRAALMGWVATTLNGGEILAAAGGVKRGMQVQISHRNPGAKPLVVAAAGSAEPDAQVRVVPISAEGAWTVRIAGQARVSGLSANTQFWIILLAGLGISGLLFGFVRVLARSRGKALDMVARKTSELRHLTLHDGLTGLPNRVLILDRVEHALTRARRQTTQLAVMFLDLDGFKAVNDTLGHAAGDELLRAVSARLKNLLRESDTVGRLGGDEFVVVAEGDSLDAGPEVIADRIREVLAAPFMLGDPADQTRAQIHVSIGIALGLRASAEEMLRDADIALYEAKETGKDRFVLFAPEMYTVIEQRLELERDLAQAIDRDQLFLAYQPTFDLTTQSINGVEALLRWDHPTLGLIMPDDFVALAESNGLIVPIGRWVLNEACRQASQWQTGDHPLTVSVNVSGRQLDPDVDLVTDVKDALTHSGLHPELLTLEITETVLMRDAQASAAKLHALKRLGLRIAIDDFGTGYSSLGYLRQFPVDALKIDRSFISGIATNPQASALIHTLVQLGKTLGIETLAEGIEETSQLHQLQREACDSGQGYLFARPLTPEAVTHFIAGGSPACDVQAAPPGAASAQLSV